MSICIYIYIYIYIYTHVYVYFFIAAAVQETAVEAGSAYMGGDVYI